MDRAPLRIICDPAFSTLPPTRCSVVLLNVTIAFHRPLAVRRRQLTGTMSVASFLVLTLPYRTRIGTRGLGRSNVNTYLLGPLAPAHLLPTLARFYRRGRGALLPMASRDGLTVAIVTISSGPTGLGLVNTLLRSVIRRIRLYSDKRRTIRQTGRVPFSLVLVSVRVPSVSNVQTYRLVRRLPRRRRAPIVTMATRTVTKRGRGLLNTKVDSCLTGPVRRRQLRGLLLHCGPNDNVSSHIIAPRIGRVIIGPGTALS